MREVAKIYRVQKVKFGSIFSTVIKVDPKPKGPVIHVAFSFYVLYTEAKFGHLVKMNQNFEFSDFGEHETVQVGSKVRLLRKHETLIDVKYRNRLGQLKTAYCIKL